MVFTNELLNCKSLKIKLTDDRFSINGARQWLQKWTMMSRTSNGSQANSDATVIVIRIWALSPILSLSAWFKESLDSMYTRCGCPNTADTMSKQHASKLINLAFK